MKGSKYPKSEDKPYRAWVAEHDCIIAEAASRLDEIPASWNGCGYYPDRRSNEPCHVKAWGSSGLDHGNIYSGCPGHHDEQEGKTKAFERKYGVRLKAVARQFWVRYEREVLDIRI